MNETLSTQESSDETPTTTRRRALMLLGGTGLGLFVAAACEPESTGTTSASGGSTTVGSSAGGRSGGGGSGSAGAIPEETAGPYPGDGSNGPNVLTQSGVVRSDIRSSFGSSTTTAAGIPLTVKLKITEATSGAALAGAAVYIWHCDISGRYSMYSPGVTNENYLRGVQEADSNGEVTFLTVFPAAYSGRWPHIHFEVYPTLAAATSAGKKTATSQLALPKDTFDLVYATAGYESSVTNASRVTLATDMVFSDGADQETPTMAGSVADGFTASLTVPV